MTRHDFYEQQQRLSNLLHEDLTRNDFERRKSAQTKSKYFELNNKSQCLDDLNSMRAKSAGEKKTRARTALKAHIWYGELINKVVAINGVRREVTAYETVLLRQLKGYIEDQILFTKKVFVQFMRILPTKEYQKDEIQRIIRFVKQRENITERDFLEAVELAGHGIGL